MPTEKMSYFFNTLDMHLRLGKAPRTAIEHTVQYYADLFEPGYDKAHPVPSPTTRSSAPVKPANCTCAYPAMMARNPSGHAPDCPVYVAYWSKVESSQAPAKPARAKMKLKTFISELQKTLEHYGDIDVDCEDFEVKVIQEDDKDDQYLIAFI